MAWGFGNLGGGASGSSHKTPGGNKRNKNKSKAARQSRRKNR